MRLTDLSVRALKSPEKGAKVYHDETLAGFGVRVTRAGIKSYVLTFGPRRTRKTLGRVGIVSLKSARQKAVQLLSDQSLGKDQPRSISWLRACAEFLERKTGELKAATIEDYRMHLSYFPFGDTKLTDISPHELQADLDKIASKSERYSTFVVLRAFLNWAHKRHYIDRNPIERVESTRGSKPRERILTDDELRKVWTACRDDTFSKIVKLLILTGQRRGEIAQLTSDMVAPSSSSAENGTIILPSWLTKNGREHSFPTGSLLLTVLSPLESSTTLAIFPARGTTKPFNGWSKSKAALDKRSGVENWTLHDLRRTYASGLAKLGVRLEVIERLLNHVSGSFAGIVGVYQKHDFAAEMKLAVDKWDAFIQALISRELD